VLSILCAKPDIATGSFVGGAASSKKNLTSHTLIAASCLILLGCGLMSTLGGGREIYKPTYGYEIILGLGIGLTFSGGTLMTNLAIKSEDAGMSFRTQRPLEGWSMLMRYSCCARRSESGSCTRRQHRPVHGDHCPQQQAQPTTSRRA